MPWSSQSGNGSGWGGRHRRRGCSLDEGGRRICGLCRGWGGLPDLGLCGWGTTPGEHLHVVGPRPEKEVIGQKSEPQHYQNSRGPYERRLNQTELHVRPAR